MTLVRFSLCVLLTTAVLGCGSHGLVWPTKSHAPPTPPKTCNAIWPKTNQIERGDTVVIARCRGADDYATTFARKDWNYHWYLVSMDVLAVERGTWNENEVNFVYPDAWPTPGSGIRIDKVLFPFAKGYIFALTLKTRAQPATLVAFEQRSYVPPYGALKYIKLNSGKNGPESEYGRIQRAVADYETAHNIAAQRAVIDATEDAGDTWIVHRRDGRGTNGSSYLYRVDKATFTVQAIP